MLSLEIRRDCRDDTPHLAEERYIAQADAANVLLEQDPTLEGALVLAPV
jgi:hypothetical protein